MCSSTTPTSKEAATAHSRGRPGRQVRRRSGPQGRRSPEREGHRPPTGTPTLNRDRDERPRPGLGRSSWWAQVPADPASTHLERPGKHLGHPVEFGDVGRRRHELDLVERRRRGRRRRRMRRARSDCTTQPARSANSTEHRQVSAPHRAQLGLGIGAEAPPKLVMRYGAASRPAASHAASIAATLRPRASADGSIEPGDPVRPARRSGDRLGTHRTAQDRQVL